MCPLEVRDREGIYKYPSDRRCPRGNARQIDKNFLFVLCFISIYRLKEEEKSVAIMVESIINSQLDKVAWGTTTRAAGDFRSMLTFSAPEYALRSSVLTGY